MVEAFCPDENVSTLQFFARLSGTLSLLTAVSLGFAAGCSRTPEQAAIESLSTLANVRIQLDNEGHVRELTSSEFTDAQAPQLASFSLLKKLTLSGAELGDSGLQVIQQLPELEVLVLDESNITNAGLASLTNCRKLQQLNLAGCSISDEGLKSLSQLTELRVLNLDRTQVTGPGLAHLGGMANLELLSLQGSAVVFEPCPSLTGLSRLKTLHLAHTKVDGSVSCVLSDLPGLERLYLDGTMISDDDLPELAAVLSEKTPKLKGLFIDRTNVSDASIDAFQPLTKLADFSLIHMNGTRISLEGYVKLRGLLPEANLISSY